MAIGEVINPTPAVRHLSKKAVPISPDITPYDLLRIAVTQGAELEKVERLIQIWREWKQERAREAFVVAKNAFKAEAPSILKNAVATIRSDKGSYEYSYAELAAACDVVVPLLAKHGLGHNWRAKQKTGRIEITCTLTHSFGHFEEATLEGPEDHTGGKNAIQAIGSTATYLERYTLLMACGLAAKCQDTDANVHTHGEASAALVPTSRIKPERREELLGEIRRASSIDQLFRAFKLAFTEAHEASDQNAQNAYIAAKDARKRGFANGNR